MNLNFLKTILLCVTQQKDFILCNPNSDELKIIDHRNESLDIWLNDLWELTFTVDNLNRKGNDYNDYYDLINKDRIIKISEVAEFVITECSETDNGRTKTKKVICKSIEYNMTNKIISYMECKAYKFYDALPVNIPDTFLGIVLSFLPNWTIGYVNTSLYSKYRVFDISSDTNIYNLLKENGQKAYECIFTFDRINKTINAYTKDEIIKQTDLIISFENLVKELDITPIFDGKVTSLAVSGANDMGIALVNPLGTNYIYNLDNVIDEVGEQGIRTMTLETSNAWKTWKERYNTLKVGYAANVLSIKNKKASILTYQTQLSTLNAEVKALKDSISIFTTFYEDKTALVNEYNQKMSAIVTVENNISTLKTEINTLMTQQTVTNLELRFSNFFTNTQLKELDSFIKTSKYADENFAVTDSMTDVEEIEMSQELFDKAWRELNILCTQRYSFDVNMLCPFFVDNFNLHKDQLDLGAEILLQDSKGNNYTPLLIGASIPFDNLENVSFTFSESVKNQNNELNLQKLLGQTANVATNLAINNIKYNSYVDSGDKQTLEKMRTEALDVDKQALINGIDKTITIDNTGILCKALDTNGVNGYSPYQSWWNNNILMFTDDYWKHAKMGIGLITLPNGQKAYGANNEKTYSKLI